MPVNHSASVSSVSRTKAWRCLIRLVMICLKRASSQPSSLASTASVRFCSVRLRMSCSPERGRGVALCRGLQQGGHPLHQPYAGDKARRRGTTASRPLCSLCESAIGKAEERDDGEGYSQLPGFDAEVESDEAGDGVRSVGAEQFAQTEGEAEAMQ